MGKEDDNPPLTPRRENVAPLTPRRGARRDLPHGTGPAAVVAVAALLMVGCSTGTPSTAGQPDRGSSPARTSSGGPGSAISAAPGPTNVGSFDAVHAAQVLNPSVG